MLLISIFHVNIMQTMTWAKKIPSYWFRSHFTDFFIQVSWYIDIKMLNYLLLISGWYILYKIMCKVSYVRPIEALNMNMINWIWILSIKLQKIIKIDWWCQQRIPCCFRHIRFKFSVVIKVMSGVILAAILVDTCIFSFSKCSEIVLPENTLRSFSRDIWRT